MGLRRIGEAIEWAGQKWRSYIYDNTDIDDVENNLSPEGYKVGEKKLVERWYYNSIEYETNVEIEWDGEAWRRT